MGLQSQELISKVQYKNFEPGEFTDRQQRNYEQTIALIEQFPWDKERDHLVVSLTNPSVTIEGPFGDFLKLALYYHDKFVLYYYNEGKQLYTASFAHYPDAYPAIRSFYENPSAVPDGFKLENTWMQHNGIHFQDGNFHYAMNPLKIFPWAIAAAFMCLLFLFSLLQFILGPPGRSTSIWPLLIILPLLVLFYGGRLLLLFLNHYRSAKGKILILSKGKDLFFYGPRDEPLPFHKKDILKVVTYGRRGRNGYPMLTKVVIDFKDGQSLNISCMMLQRDTFVSKFPECPKEDIQITFSFIPAAASALS